MGMIQKIQVTLRNEMTKREITIAEIREKINAKNRNAVSNALNAPMIEANDLFEIADVLGLEFKIFRKKKRRAKND